VCLEQFIWLLSTEKDPVDALEDGEAKHGSAGTGSRVTSKVHS